MTAPDEGHRAHRIRDYAPGSVDLGPQAPPTPAWSARLIANGGPHPPAYGSAEWLALDDNDPAKVAATVAAAEAWRVVNDPAVIADQLRCELAAREHLAVVEEERAWQAVAADVRSRAGRPTYAQLAELRGNTEAAARARTAELARRSAVAQ